MKRFSSSQIYALGTGLLALLIGIASVRSGMMVSPMAGDIFLVTILSFLFAYFPILVSPDVEVLLQMPLALAFIVIRGPLFGIVSVVVGRLISVVLAKQPWEKIAFNVGAVFLEAVAASFVYKFLGSPSVLYITPGLIGILSLMSLSDGAVTIALFSGLLTVLSGKNFIAHASEVSQLVFRHIAIEAIVAVLFLSINLSMGTAGLFLMATLLLLTRYGFKTYYELRASYEEVQAMLISILDARDSYTAGHSTRVAENAVLLARELQLPPREVENLRRAALLHDIGKVNVPDHVLKKPATLSEEETIQMNQHPTDGARFVEGVTSLRHLAPVIRHHHERLDGGGYPDGLAGEDIPYSARILLVADAFDAMTTDRPYRKALTRAEALRRLAENAGTQFDPKVAWAAVRVFGADLPQYAEIREVFTQGQLEAAASRESILGKGRA